MRERELLYYLRGYSHEREYTASTGPSEESAELVGTYLQGRMYTDGSSSSWSCLPYPKPSRSLPSYTSVKEARDYVLGTGYVRCKWGCAGDGSGLDTYVSTCGMLPLAGGGGVWKW